MSDVGSNLARGDRYRSDDLRSSTAGSEGHPGESWHYLDNSTMANSAGTGAVPVPEAKQVNDDTSMAQKMVSATSGSILTALLGKLSARCGMRRATS